MRHAELAYLEQLIKKLESILAQKVPLEFDRPVDVFEERVNMYERDLTNFKEAIECHIEVYADE